MDLFTACCHGGGALPLLQRILTSLRCASHVSPEVGVDIPALWPGLGPFSTASGELSPPFAAGKATESFIWPVPPALCHPRRSENSRWVVPDPALPYLSPFLPTVCK